MSRAMKDSGVAWIGKIPEGWQCRPIKNRFTVYSGATPKSETSEYWDGEIIWVTPADFKTQDRIISAGKRNLTAEGYSSCGTTLVPSGSIVFSKRAPIGTVAVANTELCTNQGCLSCVPHDGVDTWFFYYAMSVFTEQFNLYGTGTTFKEISYNDFINFLLPIPPLPEQSRIAAFLDRRCAEIDRVIAATQLTIEEYKKLKQSIITEAVTHGVRGERKMKDSGVEWIGEIPEDWETVRIKYLLQERNERSVSGEEEPLSMSQKYGLIPTREMDMVPNMASSFVGAKLAYENDLVFNKLKAHLGVFSVSRYYGLVSPDYAVYFSTGLADLKYLEYIFKTPQCIAEFKKKSTGIAAGLTRLYTDGLFSIVLPHPSLEEQQEITVNISRQCIEIDRLIDAKQELIAQLEAYKKSVIYEYVTGKREV